MARTASAALPRARPVEAALIRERTRPVTSTVVAEGPFFRLVRLEAERDGPCILFVPPYSGYAAGVASPLIAALLDLGRVLVPDWRDARLVRAAEGRFGLVEQTATVRAILDLLPMRVHLVGLSQSCPAVLIAAAMHAAAHPSRRPASLALLGGPLEPRRRPTALQRLVTACPRLLLTGALTSVVPAPLPGVGRRVYPSLLQLAALIAADPGAYAALQRGLLDELAGGSAPALARVHEDLHDLVDVPAELFHDMVDWLDPDAHAWPTAPGALDLRGLAGLPVLTAEAGADGLVGHGQTHAVRHRLGDPPGPVIDLPGAPHQALFTGARFGAHLAPGLRQLIAGTGT